MGVPIGQLLWLTAGFFMGMFFMYNVVPFRVADHHHLLKRQQTTTANEVLKFGNPGPVVDLLERVAYTVSYNRKDRIPYWAGEHLTRESLENPDGNSRDDSVFTKDTDIPELFRAYSTDYTGSGYDRGHNVPAADALRTMQGLNETFLMSNIAPQVGVGFNRQYWAYLERFCRELTKTFSDVYVYTGPLFLPRLETNNSTYALGTKNMNSNDFTNVDIPKQSKERYIMTYPVIGSPVPNVAVPTHFYKVILVATSDNSYGMSAFALPNQSINSKTPLINFQVGLEGIEKATGLQFFELLDRTQLKNLCQLTLCEVVK